MYRIDWQRDDECDIHTGTLIFYTLEDAARILALYDRIFTTACHWIVPVEGDSNGQNTDTSGHPSDTAKDHASSQGDTP